MSDATEISAARTKLYNALVPIAARMPGAWRVHRVIPAQIAAPTIWIESVELATQSTSGFPMLTATFPVYVVVDGTVAKQIEQLDDLIAMVWQSASTVGDPDDARPTSLDVGGPSLRAHALRIGIPIGAPTLCPLDLILTT